VLVSYEFVDVRFRHFAKLKLRVCTELHWSIRLIYWKFSYVWVLIKLTNYEICTKTSFPRWQVQTCLLESSDIKCTGTRDVWFSFPYSGHM